MSGRGRHRRQTNRRIPRGISRASIVALTAGGAGVALPLIGAGNAQAAPVGTWDKVAQCESSGNWQANTGNGFSGGLQFNQSTWSGNGGTKYAPSADKASKDQQIAVAEKVLASQGPGAWPSCGPKAGLTQNSGSPQINPSGKSGGSGEQSGQPAGQQSQKPQSPSAGKSYSVASGDTLASISRAKHVQGGWHKLYDANKSAVGGDPDLIRPGQKLTLTGGGDSGGGQPSGGDQGGDQGGSASGASSNSYGNNLDGWIHQALDIMKSKGIPGSYEGIKRNIMRESAGNPDAVNQTDVNAQNGTPSKGLLQTIQPTFDQYHVDGTSNDMTDPVANIVAACNYAAAKYGSMDNVDGAY